MFLSIISKVKLENELEEYRGLAPQNTINVVENREKYAHFFDNWSPIPENLDEEGNDSGPSSPLSHQLTMNEIDTRAREVYTPSLSFLKNSKDFLNIDSSWAFESPFKFKHSYTS